MSCAFGWARSVAPLALCLCALAASAAELVLYAEPGFRGRRIALQVGVTALNHAVDFNDRARSLEVRDGLWEVCVDADFHGPCATLEPGRYPRLDGVLDGRISSARPLRSALPGRAQPGGFGPPPGERFLAGARGRPPGGLPPGYGEIVLFDDVDFRGRRRVVDRDDPDLDRSGFNDRAASILVRAGRWEVCRDAGFGGGCLLLEPGEYRRLEPRWQRRVSSVRLVDDGVMVVRPPAPALPGISSCSAGAAGACAPCSVTCSDGRRAVCSPGSMGDSYGCIEPAVCRCSGARP